MAHWLGGWCPLCAKLGSAGAFLAVFGFGGWEKHCHRCGRTPEKAANDAKAVEALVAAHTEEKDLLHANLPAV